MTGRFSRPMADLRLIGVRRWGAACAIPERPNHYY